jgi:hypothetical protein
MRAYGQLCGWTLGRAHAGLVNGMIWRMLFLKGCLITSEAGTIIKST